jgi:hypothetical protein
MNRASDILGTLATFSDELPAADIVLLPPATREDGVERSS